jgi:16S rRNA (cytidine1402-2'-O)-methyltransferase
MLENDPIAAHCGDKRDEAKAVPHIEKSQESAVPSPDIRRAVGHQMERLLAQPLDAGLHLVATPIGHLGDISLRALATLAQADVIYCEDTRRTRILADHYGIDRPLRSYHEHNAERERPQILARLGRGDRVALVSDAGTPLVSDPGYKLVRDAIEAGCMVTCVPGASSVLTALTVSGLPTDAFHFGGFMPPRGGQRRNRLEQLATVPATLVLFETASRIEALVADAAEILGGDRPAAVARELTKLHEEIIRAPLGELPERIAGLIGEIVLVIGPAPERAVDDAAIEARLRALLETQTLKDAARIAADELAIPKARAYDIALAIKRGAP